MSLLFSYRVHYSGLRPVLVDDSLQTLFAGQTPWRRRGPSATDPQ